MGSDFLLAYFPLFFIIPGVLYHFTGIYEKSYNTLCSDRTLRIPNNHMIQYIAPMNRVRMREKYDHKYH